MNKTASRFGPYQHLAGISYFFCVSLFFAGVICTTAPGALGLAAIFLAFMHLAAMWAVLGPGRYWQNCFWSLAACLLVGSSGLFGVAIGTGMIVSITETFELVGFGPTFWILAQVPYWICRLMFGWQIVSNESTVHRPVSIKELMAFTALAALSLSMLQFSYSRGVSDGRVASGEMIDALLLPISLFVIGTFVLVCLPTLILVFSKQLSPTKIVILLSILGLITGAAFVGLIMLNSSAVVLVLALCIFSAAFSVPLIFHRRQGFYLQLARVA